MAAQQKKFEHWDILLPQPAWQSDLPRKIIDLEKLRDKRLVVESIDIFMELKIGFQRLENWASARIEGNQTRLVDALRPATTPKTHKETIDQHELRNLSKAIDYVESYCKENNQLTLNFILDIHKIVVDKLPIGNSEPGDATPGKFRTKQVEITESNHVPPIGVKVNDYMQELVDFANEPHANQDYLLVAAVFHHRFTWIHPFTNGNGRVVRLLTYAMLQIMGYGVTKNRLLNPTAVFYANRSRYYKQLSLADNGSSKGLLAWCDYFLGGLLEEINKIDKLLDTSYVRDSILTPVIKDAYGAKRISDDEYSVLRWSLNQPGFTFVSGDINTALNSNRTPLERSRMIKRMRELDIITPAYKSKQKYVIELWSDIFIVYLIAVLRKEGFVEPTPHSP